MTDKLLLYYFLTLFFDCSWASVVTYICCRCAAQRLDIYLTYKVFPPVSLAPTWPRTWLLPYYWYIPCAVLGTPVTTLQLPICTSYSLPLFHPAPKPPFQPPLRVLYLWVCFGLACSFLLVIRFHTEVKSRGICLSPCDWCHLASHPLGPSALSQMGRLRSFCDWIMFHGGNSVF